MADGGRGVNLPRGLLRGAVDCVFPPVCVACGAPGGTDAGWRCVCAACARHLARIEPPLCTTCGHPFDGDTGSHAGCPHCRQLDPAYGEGRALVLLRGAGRELVHGLKYRGETHVLRDVAALARAASWFAGFVYGARLVPVPLHPRKMRERGFNQGRLLAETFARSGPAWGVDDVLERQVDTATQTRLDREQRAANVKNAFAVARGRRLHPAARYVIVDDVFTTGSTLSACAAALRRAGCPRVDVLTLGHG